MKYIITLFFFFSLSACINHKKTSEHHAHTHKLVRPLSVKFLAKDRVLVKRGAKNLKNIRLQVFHKLQDSKTVLFDGKIEDPESEIDFEVSKSIEESGGVLAAIVTGSDLVDKEVSSVDSYILGEQEEINTAKEVLKRN